MYRLPYPTRAALAEALRRLMAAGIALEGATTASARRISCREDYIAGLRARVSSNSALSARSGRERGGVVLGSAARGMAAHAGGWNQYVHAGARFGGVADCELVRAATLPQALSVSYDGRRMALR